MTLFIPPSEFEKLKALIARQFPANECDEVYALVEPFTDDGTRVAKCILKLAKGSKAQVAKYAEWARTDYRDVIFWAESPDESALDTPEKIEDFQATLQWLGLPRDQELDQTKEEAMASQQAPVPRRTQRRPWWRFWTA